jgi:hypothetical protein
LNEKKVTISKKKGKAHYKLKIQIYITNFVWQGFYFKNIINNMGFVETKFKIFISIEIGGFHGPQMFITHNNFCIQIRSGEISAQSSLN